MPISRFRRYINISKKIAGFSLQEADVLRKSVGKKKPELMAKVKKDFLQGCKKTGIVNEEQAKDIFSWIEASQRYSFNKSHAVAYGLNSYMSAYLKSHFPNEFFTSYLYYAKNKQDPQTEMRELINDAKLNNVVVNKPNINIKNKNFSLVDNIIYFGLQDVKGIGSSTYDGLIKVLSEKEQQLDKKILYWTWIDFLIFLSPYIKKTIVEGLIYSGALDHMNIDRLRMEFEYDKYMTLSNRERKYIEENIENPKDIKEILNTIIDLGSGKKFACYNKNRLSHCKELLKIIENPPLDIGTNIGVLASKEEYYLGLPLQYSELYEKSNVNCNCTCSDLNKNKAIKLKSIIFSCKIDEFREINTRHGEPMCFLKVSDDTGSLDSVVIFPDKWMEFKKLVKNDNTVAINAVFGKENSLIVNKIFQL